MSTDPLKVASDGPKDAFEVAEAVEIALVEHENEDLGLFQCDRCGVDLDVMRYCQIGLQSAGGHEYDMSLNLCPCCEIPVKAAIVMQAEALSNKTGE